MKKKVLCLCSIMLVFVLIFWGCKINQVYKKIKLVSESVIAHVQQLYPEYEYYVEKIKRNGDNYNVTLRVADKKLRLVKINCEVITSLIENGYYHVKIWSSTNIDYLQE